MRALALAWLAGIPNLVAAASLQGLSLASSSMVLTMLRQAALPVLLALALRAAGSLSAIWFAFALAEAVCLPLGEWLWRRGFHSALERR